MVPLLHYIFKHLLHVILIFFIIFHNKAFSKYIRDTEIENIIYSWTAPILRAANLEKNNLKIHILADNNINAFVTNGKNMFLNTGLILKAGSAAPNDVLRTTYEQAILAGEVNNKADDALMHNYLAKN